VRHTFNLQHANSTNQLAIISPIPSNYLDNALIDLADDQNWTATDAVCPAPVNVAGNPEAVCFSAETNTGNSISWQLQLQYTTSGGYAPIYDPNGAFLTFSTTNGQQKNKVYQNEGGRLTNIIASTTASDGSTVQDCTNAYIEGPAGGIPNASITTELDTLYPASPSYPNDGTQHLNLLTGVAWVESSYSQFRRPDEGNANLYNGVNGKWPYESVGGGKYIGLMQRQTASNQASDPNAWSWITNASDAVNLFSGTPSPNEIQLATNFESWIIGGFNGTYNGVQQSVPGHVGLATLNGSGLENMALVLYNGDVNLQQTSLSTTLQQQYYIPSCSGQTKKNNQGNLTCSTGWQWIVNNSNQASGVTYVANVQAHLM
jgi:hypothetical protein